VIKHIILIIIVVIASTVITVNAYQQEPQVVIRERVEIVKAISYRPIDGLEFNITAYCPCSICCGVHADGITASGTRVKEGRTIAVDPEVIPLGSRVIVEGFDTVFIAEDTGNPKYMSGKRIDIYLSDHDAALKFGREDRKVWVLQ